MKIRYLGHSCFEWEMGGKKVLIDPFIKGNALAKDIDLKELVGETLLLSHGHIDHMADAEELAKQNNALIVANWEIHSWFNAKGWEKTHPMNLGGQWAFDFGSVKMVQADHSSSMPDGAYGGNAGGFIVNTEKHCFYYAGDTALFRDMKMFGKLHKPEFAFLPIGDNFTMGFKEAALSANMLGVKKVIGMHYDTFGYIKIDHNAAKDAFAEKGIELILMKIGETLKM